MFKKVCVGVLVARLDLLQHTKPHQNSHYDKGNCRDPQQYTFGDQLAQSLPADDADSSDQDQGQRAADKDQPW